MTDSKELRTLNIVQLRHLRAIHWKQLCLILDEFMRRDKAKKVLREKDVSEGNGEDSNIHRIHTMTPSAKNQKRVN